ncbi:MAG: hypothetical protein P8X73_01065 [Ignavibacteriaceae bacterium]
MRYLSVTSILLLLLITVTGCNEEPTSTENSSTPVGVSGFLNKGDGPSANGSAILPEEFLEGYFQNFSFHASENQDGNITGMIEFTCRIPSSGRVHGTIECMTIDGNQATMSGVVTHSDIPGYQPGRLFWFRVVDNGEGNNSAADQFSDVWGLPEGYSLPCTESLPFNFDMFEIEHGNIQVKP